MGAFFGIRPIIGAIAALFIAAITALSIAAWLAAPAAAASTPSVDIHSAGPLTDIYVGNDLSCQVRSGGFSSTEYYPNASGPGDCGTFLYLSSATIPNTLFGPDFANHAGGTHTTGFSIPETPFTASASNQSFTGTGTAASPYRVTTVVTGTVLNHSSGRVALQITEVDSYVVGNNFYETDVTVQNIGGPNDASLDAGGELYHAADCQLRGLDTGLGAFEPNLQSAVTAACTPNVLGNPPSALEEFTPITTGASWEQTTVPTIWANLDGNALNDNCNDCRGAVDNAEGIEYPVPDLSPGQSSPTISFDTKIVDTVPAGGFSFNGSAAMRSAEPSPRSRTRTRVPPRAHTSPRSTGATARPRPARSPAATAASMSPATTRIRPAALIPSRSRSRQWARARAARRSPTRPRSTRPRRP